jgi:cell division protein FtsB
MTDEAPRLAPADRNDPPRPGTIAEGVRERERVAFEMSEQRAEERFETERRWLIGLAFSIVALAGSTFYAGGQMAGQIEQNATEIARLRADFSSLSNATATDRTAAARLEERLNALVASSNRVEAIVERLYRSQQEREP